jgi:hypothetical protein
LLALLWFKPGYVSPAIKYVIPAAAKRRAGIQQKLRYYWIPAFARMTGWSLKVVLFNRQMNFVPAGNRRA